MFVQVHSKISPPSLIDIAGVISSIAEQTFYIEKFRKWIGKDLNFRSLSKNGNGSTAGKLKFGLKWSKNFNWIQKRLAILSALQSINAYNNGEINGNMLAFNLASTTYSVYGGMYGTAWGTGQLIGQGIASFPPYLRNIRPLIQDLFRVPRDE
jgi:hypothetical protein